jgi:peptidoglycan/xylan/chitin deacetylase (PgdA/CDA1 family)
MAPVDFGAEMTAALRRMAKRVSRGGLAAAAGLPLRLAATLRGPAASVRALTYHRFAARPRDPYAVPPAEFRRHAERLARSGRVIAAGDIEAALTRGEPLRPGGILVTIDDGYACTLTEAMPILRDFHLPAIAFVTPSRLGGEDAIGRSLTWRELEVLIEAGIEIGSHGWTHVPMATLDAGAMAEQAFRSKETLEHITGRRVTAFAYPYGTRADFSAATRRALVDAGYRIAFSSQHGAIHPDTDPLLLPRIKIESGEIIGVFAAALDGGLDGWAAVDRFLWRLQVRGRDLPSPNSVGARSRSEAR